jgi:putative transposase
MSSNQAWRVPSDMKMALKTTKPKIDKAAGEVVKPSVTVWDSASGIQSKVTSGLRGKWKSYADIDCCVLQRNLSKLDTAFTNFWQQKVPALLARIKLLRVQAGYG